jgi:hypothetical protein
MRLIRRLLALILAKKDIPVPVEWHGICGVAMEGSLGHDKR